MLGADLLGGDGFVQIGEWRFGDADGSFFSFSHGGGKTAAICRNDGTIQRGPCGDCGLWGKIGGAATNVVVAMDFIEFSGV